MEQRICILEDDKDVQYNLMMVLMAEGYDVEALANGYPLFDKSGTWPDLFIVDIDLPGINGFEMCKWLKSQDETSNIPVLFVSGSPELNVLAESVPVNGCISKKFTTDALLEKVTALLSVSQEA